VLQFPLLIWLSTGKLPPAPVLAAAPSTVLMYLGYLWLVNRPFREVLAVVKSGEGLFVGYTRGLRRQMGRARLFAVTNLSLPGLGLLLGSLARGLRGRRLGLGGAAVFGLWAAYALKSKLPRLRRALAEVSQ